MIFGAGMIGNALRNLLGCDVDFLGFIDSAKEGCFRPSQVAEVDPDMVILGCRDLPRQEEMWSSLEDCGYRGTVMTPDAMEIFDPRCAVMRLLAKSAPAGAVAELGVYKGDFALRISEAFRGREIHLFDTFEGFDGRDTSCETGLRESENEAFTDTSAEAVLKKIPGAVIHKGWFPDTFRGCEDMRFAFVSLDADLYAPTKAGLEIFYPRLEKGGCIMVHDYNSSRFPGVKEAVDAFCADNGITPLPVGDLHGSVMIAG